MDANLNPEGITLADYYMQIVDEFAAMPDDLASIEAMYAGTKLLPTMQAKKDFDHSLHFRA